MRRIALMALIVSIGLCGTARAQAPKATTRSNPLKGLGVTLVLGDRRAGSSGDLPATATKALADLKDFLPYRKYQVLDTAWAPGNGQSRLALQGVSGKDYTLDLRFQAPNDAGVTRVDLLRLGATGPSPEALKAQMATLVAQRQHLHVDQNLGVHHPIIEELDARINELQAKLKEPFLLIDTTFTIKLRETVVVGTSRLDGDQALILLVTALPE